MLILDYYNVRISFILYELSFPSKNKIVTDDHFQRYSSHRPKKHSFSFHKRKQTPRIPYLEVDHTTSFSGRAVAVIGQRLSLPVEDEPSFVPVMEFLAHLR